MTATLTFTPKAGGPSSTREMRYLIVFKRQPRGDYVEPDYPYRRVPERY